ncbi:MAG: exodeoxyribonuclease VII small subunit [Proteobacteria bacterium]|nr:exodeoxyribonuclease VII small subunit [Pseudomonadota bacterium]MBU4471565.1 exodeoxyribonuclease VII small subunit [Pseudomonadota bacterium]MCG2752571.1 exodeoxyribonuclease VII small subunit [Desulfobacteraceae bacterium]
MAKKTFEQSLKQLEKIVAELESGDIPIESAMKKFEEGVELSKCCSQILDETEKKVTLLMKNNDNKIIETTFAYDDELDTSAGDL